MMSAGKTGFGPSGERGAVYGLTAISMFAVMAAVALAVDGFLAMASSLQQDNNAEYAALAALQTVQSRCSGTLAAGDITAAVDRAEAITGWNKYVGSPGADQAEGGLGSGGSAGSVEVGWWNPASRSFSARGAEEACSGVNAVRISLHTQSGEGGPATAVQTLFAGVMGVQRLNVSSTVTSYYNKDLAPKFRIVE